MIISASRRTDIPAYFSDWFYRRMEEGFVHVRNPMNIHQVSEVPLTPDVVDGIVFWTKDARPLMSRLHQLSAYPFYFQYTVNPYDADLEPGVPKKASTIIPAFQELAEMVGKERVIWRYDPIVLTDKYTVDEHAHRFRLLADKLAGHTEKCVISFVDLYKKTQRNMAGVNLLPLGVPEMEQLAEAFSGIAREHGLSLETCAEALDLDAYGIKHAHCIDRGLLERISGTELDVGKDKNQRLECGCVASIDIGAYNTCSHLCRYCYANFNEQAVKDARAQHDPQSTLLVGHLSDDDVVTPRKAASLKSTQPTLF